MKRRDILEATGVGLGIDLESILRATGAPETTDESPDVANKSGGNGSVAGGQSGGNVVDELLTAVDPNDFGGTEGFRGVVARVPAGTPGMDRELLDGATTLATVFGHFASVSVPFDGAGSDTLDSPSEDALRKRGYELAGLMDRGRVYVKRRRTRVEVVVSTPAGPLFGRGPAVTPVLEAVDAVGEARASATVPPDWWTDRVTRLLSTLEPAVYRAVEPPPTGDTGAATVGRDTTLRGRAVSLDGDTVTVRVVVDSGRVEDSPKRGELEDEHPRHLTGSLIGASGPDSAVEVRRRGQHVIYESTATGWPSVESTLENSS